MLLSHGFGFSKHLMVCKWGNKSMGHNNELHNVTSNYVQNKKNNITGEESIFTTYRLPHIMVHVFMQV